MKNKGNALLIVLVIVGLLTLVGFMVFRGRSTQPKTSVGQNMQDNSTSTPNEGHITVTEGGRYVEYSSNVLEMYPGKRRVLFFYANWCPICRPLDAELQKDPTVIPEDVVLIRVNYNDSDTDSDEKNLAAKYGITYQHTFVEIDNSGNEVQKWNGGGVSDLLKRLQ